jgi:AhpD family alkylhydroperoxidase
MEERINYSIKGQDALKALYGVGGYLAKSPLGQPLLNLVYFRVSQINGCAYCLDMHSKDLLASGEKDQRLYALGAWRRAPFYTEKERAALAWAEAVNVYDVPDEIYAEARKHFSETELIDLTLAVSAVSSYNRFNHAFRPVVGSYQVGKWG